MQPPLAFHARILDLMYRNSKTVSALVHTNTAMSHTRVLSYRKVSDVLCLHTSIMAKDLKPGKELPLRNFSAGTIIAFKSTRFDLNYHRPTPFNSRLSTATTPPPPTTTHLDLYSAKNDIVLRITFRDGQNKVFFNDCADKTLLNGWGKEQSVDLNSVDIEKWRRSGVTISVHYPLPHYRSKEQYQILFDLTTVFYFHTRFPEPAIKMGYSIATQSHQLSDPLKVFCYQLADLPLVERQAIESGK